MNNQRTNNPPGRIAGQSATDDTGPKMVADIQRVRDDVPLMTDAEIWESLIPPFQD